MLKLPEVTLIGYDSFQPERTLKAMRFSMRQVKFGRVVFVGDANNPVVQGRCSDWEIELKHGTSDSRIDHEYFMLETIADFIETSHCLYTEWDAAVVNVSAWNPQFLEYDYVGAPWVIGAQEEQFWVSKSRPINPKWKAPITDENNCVGNGGFSLRSKRFISEVKKHVDRNNPHQICSDAWMCRTLRHQMNQLGFRYASEDLAERFSCEDRIYSGQFGFHGDNTIKLNNFNWKLDWL